MGVNRGCSESRAHLGLSEVWRRCEGRRNVIPTYSAATVCKAFSRGQPVDQAVMFAPTLNHLEDEGEICLGNILLLSFSDLSFGWCCLNMKVSPMDSCVNPGPPDNSIVWKGCGNFRRWSLGRGSPLLGAGFEVHSWLHWLSSLCSLRADAM